MSAKPTVAHDKKKLSVAVAGAAAVVAGSYFFVVSPQLSNRSADLAATEVALENARTVSEQAGKLQAQADQLEDLVTDVNRLTMQFPGDYDQGDWLRMIQAAADEAHVKLITVTPSVPVDPALVDPITGTSTAPPPAAAAIPGQPAAADPAAAAPAATAPAATDPAAAPDLAEFPIAQSGIGLTATGTADHLIDFLSHLEELDRPILTDQVKIAGEGDSLTLTLTGHSYMTRPVVVPEQLADQY